MGLLDLLTKRATDRELSAQEYVDEAKRLEATGDGAKVDAGKLEACLAAAGLSVGNFATAVEREKEIIRLSSVIAGKDAVISQHRELGQQARTIRDAHAAEIKRLEAEVVEADRAVGVAQRAVAKIGEAEKQLRLLRDDRGKFNSRTEIKGQISHATTRLRDLDQEVRFLKSDLRNDEAAGSLTPDRVAKNDKRRKALERLEAERLSLEQQLGRDNEALASMVSELVEA